MLCGLTLHTAAAPAVRVAVKIWLSFRNDAIIAFFSKANKNKGNAKVALPLLIVYKLRISGLIWRGTAYFAIILPGDTPRTTSAFPCRSLWPIFDAKLQAWTNKMFHIFHFLQSDMVLEIISPFSWIFNAISSEINGLISMLFLLTFSEVWTVKFFPPAESWLVNQISGAPAVYKTRLRGETLNYKAVAM